MKTIGGGGGVELQLTLSKQGGTRINTMKMLGKLSSHKLQKQYVHQIFCFGRKTPFSKAGHKTTYNH